MNVEFVNPFITAACDVFSTMLSCELMRGKICLKQNYTPQHEVSGVIGLSGKCQGVVVVSLDKKTAVQAASIMLQQETEEINADVIDAVGELANMIAGAAKAQFEPLQLSISLPSVICGKHHSVSFPSSSQPLAVPFESSLGPICIEVGFIE